MVRTGEGVGVSLLVSSAAPSAGPTATPSTTAGPAPVPHHLPRTGADLLPLALLAVLLLVLGTALVVAARHRLPGGSRS